MEVGQIFPGKIDTDVSIQKYHYLKINSIEEKYLFLRISTYDTVPT